MIGYLRKRASENNFDIIHAHDVLSLLAVGGMPQRKVLTLHGYFARENIEFIRSAEDRKTIYPLLFDLEKDAMKYADYVITVDERLKEYVVSKFNTPVEKITVMHNAIDTNRFSPVSEEEQQRLKVNLRFNPDNFVILVPRRLVEKNGVIFAVKAMEHVQSKSVKMLIVGDGPERQVIAKEAEKNDKTRLAGLVSHDKIDPYYKMADIILIPSITSHGVQEASSLAMLEGMACGKVVICSNIGGMREIVKDMENGVLVEEGKPVAIARAVETIMENHSLRAEIGKKAREYALQNHSFVTHASKVAKIYSSVLREHE
jgi:glycosyltransferase involved in cell wall biosynthesis